MRRKLLEGLATLAIVAVMTVGLLEGLVAWSLRYPRLSPMPLSLSRYIYTRFDRNTIQVMPECAMYDPDVTYTLRPGRCRFANREFSNEFRINRAGLRDDDESLTAPEIIMVGDSITMGWGVEQEDAFPSVVERETGQRTLNAGVSSYGTARELRLLTRLDRSRLRTLVIQHSDNDALENEHFVTSPTFKILSEAEYQRTVDNERREHRYLPGKYSLNVALQLRAIARSLANPETAPAETRIPVGRQAELFVRVLEQAPVDLTGVTVVVLTLDPAFLGAVRDAAQRSEAVWARALVTPDVGDVSAIEGAFYTLDDHPTAIGHAAIARALVATLAARH